MRRQHYARNSDRIQRMRQAAIVNASLPLVASNQAAATEAVDALNEAVGGDIGALAITLTEVGVALEGVEERLAVLEAA